MSILKRLIMDKYGTKRYYKDNILHREDGPAIEYADGTKEWYQNDLRHRTDGPAIEFTDGEKYWFLDDKQIDCKTNEKFLKIVKYKWLI